MTPKATQLVAGGPGVLCPAVPGCRTQYQRTGTLNRRVYTHRHAGSYKDMHTHTDTRLHAHGGTSGLRLACGEVFLTQLTSDHTTEEAFLLHFFLNPRVSKSQAFEGSPLPHPPPSQAAECQEPVLGAEVRLLAPSPSPATHPLRWGAALPDSVSRWVKCPSGSFSWTHLGLKVDI